MLEQKRLRDEGTDAARTEQARQGSNKMDKKNDQVAHRRIVAGREILRKYGRNNNSPATGDSSLGKVKTEHAEFPMDPRRSPGWVLNDHPKDQFPNLLRCRSSSDRPPDSGDQPPVDSKTSPVPTDDGFRRDQDERMFPSRPNRPSDYPEELIEEAETRPRMSTLQRDELLTQSEILKKESSPLTKEADQHSQAERDEAKHGLDL